MKKVLCSLTVLAACLVGVATSEGSNASVANSYEAQNVKSIHIPGRKLMYAAVGARECVGYVQDKVNLWKYPTAFKDPRQGIDYIDDEIHYLGVTLVSNDTYQYCPRGELVGLVRSRSNNHCHAKNNDVRRSYLVPEFKGWRFNDYIYDNVIASGNPPEHNVPRDGEGGNCERQYRDWADNPWLRMDQNPRRKTATWGTYSGFPGYPDPNIDMRAGSDEVREYAPGSDDNVGNRYYLN